MRTSVPSGAAYTPSQGTKSASTGSFSSRSLVSSSPRSTVRLTIVILDAPARATSTPMARAAPPAPKMTTFLPEGSVSSRRDSTKPLPSVFSPIHCPSFRTTQFTAPMRDADSPSPSRYSITFTLCGMVQLNPWKPMALAPFTASSRPSGATSMVRYRQSNSWWR